MVRPAASRPDGCLDPMAGTINAFLRDLRAFYLSGAWPAMRTSDFEAECSRIFTFMCQLYGRGHLMARLQDSAYLLVSEYVHGMMFLFDFLLGSLALEDRLPPSFKDVTGRFQAQRVGAGRLMLFEGPARIVNDEILWTSGAFALQRSYAAIASVIECMKMGSPIAPTREILNTAYSLIVPDSEGPSWTKRKEHELRDLVAAHCVSQGLYETWLRNDHWWLSGLWFRRMDVRVFEPLLRKHWEKASWEKFGQQDVLEIPRPKWNR